MSTKIFALTFTIISLLSQPLFLPGQDVAAGQQDWAAVQALSAGVKLQVEIKDGKRLKGKLNSVSPTALTLTANNKTTNLNRDDIQKIYQSRGGSRVTSALIGAAIGAGVGAGAALALLGATGGSDDTTGIIGRGTLIGAGIGTAVGVAIGKGSRRTLIYESK